MPHTIDHRCNGCSAFARQCPTGAISGDKRERYRVDPLLCIDCNVCGIICALDAVSDARGLPVARIPRDRRPRPVVRADHCNGCGLCADFCPFDCLAVVGPRFDGVVALVAPGACVSCNECARACEKGAITLRPLDLRRYDPAAETARLAGYLLQAGGRACGHEP